MRRTFTYIFISLVFACGSLLAQSIQSTNYDGGTVVTEYRADTGFKPDKINEKSSLRRSWIVLNDASSPVKMAKAGITIRYNTSDGFIYVQVGAIDVNQKVVAIEIRHVLFDVFGNHMITLSSVEIEDRPAANSVELPDFFWRTSEKDASQYLTDVVFIAQVRTADGKIWRPQSEALIRELDRIHLKVSDSELKPK